MKGDLEKGPSWGWGHDTKFGLVRLILNRVWVICYCKACPMEGLLCVCLSLCVGENIHSLAIYIGRLC